MQGEGSFAYASGAKYEGAWVANKYAGKGKYTWADGTMYEGDFVDNQCVPEKTRPRGTPYNAVCSD